MRKLLTQGHKNDTSCLLENNNGDCGKNLSEAEGQPNQDSAKHLRFDPVAAAPSRDFGRFISRFRCLYNTKT